MNNTADILFGCCNSAHDLCRLLQSGFGGAHIEPVENVGMVQKQGTLQNPPRTTPEPPQNKAHLVLSLLRRKFCDLSLINLFVLLDP